MPIRLTASGGPLDGQTYEYDKGKGAISIGRLEDCDIRFPADFRKVSRAHLTIVAENNKYRLRPEQTVFVDGREAMLDDELPPRCELRLGTQAGPAFKVEWSLLSDMPTTELHVKRRIESPARAALGAAARTRRIALAAVALVLVVAAGVAAYALLQPEPIEARLTAARPAVYLVMLRSRTGQEYPFGTAWVIAPGTLATNAHIVAGIERAKAGGHVAFVRSNVPPHATHAVASMQKHPHFEEFANLMRGRAPVTPAGQLVSSMGGYDVGILRVEAAANLAPPLRLAPPERLLHLAAGEVVASLGYPSERMAGGGVNVSAPTPTTQIGRITAMTDYFLTEGEAAERHLVQHSMSTAGGSSGSPIFNSRGEVIGIHSAGNQALVQVTGGTARVPTILVNFGQRVDLVLELTEARAITIGVVRSESWRRRIAGLPSAPEWIIQQFLTQNAADAKPALDATLTTERRSGSASAAATVEYEIPGPGLLMVVAEATQPDPLHLFVRDAGDPGKVLGRVTPNHHYPAVRLQTQAAAKVTIEAQAAAAGRHLRVRVYFLPKKS